MHTVTGLVAAVGLAISYGDQQGAVPSAPSQPDPNKVICQDRIVTGSRLAYARDCHTQAEWDVIKRASKDYLEGIQQRALERNQIPGPGGG
jgi:hypothetical protein